LKDVMLKKISIFKSVRWTRETIFGVENLNIYIDVPTIKW